MLAHEFRHHVTPGFRDKLTGSLNNGAISLVPQGGIPKVGTTRRGGNFSLKTDRDLRGVDTAIRERLDFVTDLI